MRTLDLHDEDLFMTSNIWLTSRDKAKDVLTGHYHRSGILLLALCLERLNSPRMTFA